MKECLQSDTLNLTILQHGYDVRKYYYDLYFYLEYNTELKYNWKLPDWLIENKKFILSKLLSNTIIETYQIYHDIGKPFCKIYDLDTKKYHFPNHAEVSYKTWLNLTENNPINEQIGKLIKMDMDIHTIKANQLEEFT